MKKIGTWWNDSSIDLVEQDGVIYALSGWNGEAFTGCWICTGAHHTEAGAEEFTLRPVPRYEADGIDLNALEENSPEWDKAMETVSYDISRN